MFKNLAFQVARLFANKSSAWTLAQLIIHFFDYLFNYMFRESAIEGMSFHHHYALPNSFILRHNKIDNIMAATKKHYGVAVGPNLWLWKLPITALEHSWSFKFFFCETFLWNLFIFPCNPSNFAICRAGAWFIK